MEDLGFDFVLNLGWRNSQLKPSACVKAIGSQTISASKEKRGKEGVPQGSW